MSSWRGQWLGWLRVAFSWRPAFGGQWVTLENELVRRVYAAPVYLPEIPSNSLASEFEQPVPASDLVAEAEAAPLERGLPTFGEWDDGEPEEVERQPIPFRGRAA